MQEVWHGPPNPIKGGAIVSYRCRSCGSHAPQGQKLLRHVLTRTVTPTTTTMAKRTGIKNGVSWTKMVPVELPVGPPRTEVAREVPVCEECHRLLRILMLTGGHSPADALRELDYANHVETPDWSGPPEPAAVAAPKPVKFGGEA